MRSGDEPVHARSPLRLRLVLASGGAVCWGVTAVALAVAGAGPWALVCAVGTVLALLNVLVVVRHLRAGPHWQPGPDVPPYHPVQVPDEPRARGRVRTRPSASVRMRRYLILMGACLLLAVLAWTWVWRVSMAAAAVMSLVAMVIPPIAAVVAGAGVPDPPEPGDDRRDDVPAPTGDGTRRG